MSKYPAKIAAELDAWVYKWDNGAGETLLRFPNDLVLALKQRSDKQWEVRVEGSPHRLVLDEDRPSRFAKRIQTELVYPRERLLK